MAKNTTNISKDIQSRKDIELLVDEFYKMVIKDDLIGHFFTKVIELDWDRHIPVMYDFWETSLLGEMKYKGNPMLKHIELSKKETLKPEHYERWLSLWKQSIRGNFEGEKAETAIQRGRQIGELMKIKIEKYT
ncbi:group III truncated hemoglobin [Christiangramia crocea]|uniref:Group III truncated hemoglobin n=1 Tax=Christiangramia crocea TaxID=2904124 RepID=A0A9X2A753_9FLAO|nr:group III truncated hemoglobin [Gramella crocea]MCG9972929.1 group III truncated hemoglobin [Gramella crocea]